MQAQMTVAYNHGKRYPSFLKDSFDDLDRKEFLRKDRLSKSFASDCKWERCRAPLRRSEKNLYKASLTDCYPKGYLQRSSSQPCLTKHSIYCRLNNLKSPITEKGNSERVKPKLSLRARAPGYGREEKLKIKMKKDEVQKESKPDTEKFGDPLWNYSLENTVNNTILSAPAFNISLI